MTSSLSALDSSVALTFDDVLLVPGPSDVMPGQVDVWTQLTKSVRLNIPLLSSAMDTVTEARLAIAMAQEGGIGVLHRNLSIEEQARHVAQVKRYESGIVLNPVTISPRKTLGDALKLMAEKGITGVPVVDGATEAADGSAGKGKLVGILTNRDVRFATRDDQPVSELMTKDSLVTVKRNVPQNEAKRLLHQNRIEKLIVVDDQGNCIGLITVKDIEKAARHPYASKDAQGRLRVAAATTVGEDGHERTAAADRSRLRRDRGRHRTWPLGEGDRSGRPHQAVVERCAGDRRQRRDGGRNEGPDRSGRRRRQGWHWSGLHLYDAHRGRRRRASAHCRHGVRERGRPLGCADHRRRRHPLFRRHLEGIAAGASCVMIGSLLAGTDEAPGETYLYQGRTYKSYRGMGSVGAMARGSADRYFQAEVRDTLKLVPEGIEGQVPYKGPMDAVVHQLVGGLARRDGIPRGPDDLRNSKARQVRAHFAAGIRESHAHGVLITRESPNYPGSAV